MRRQFQIAAAQEHRGQKTEWQCDQIGCDHQRDFRRAMQGHHAGTKPTDEYLVELGHDSEALRELMNANFQSLKQALVFREGE